MNKIKRSLLALGVALAPAVMFAEGDTPVYQTTATQVQTALSGALTFLGPVVASIIVAAVGLWLVPKVVRFILKCFNMGTGR